MLVLASCEVVTLPLMQKFSPESGTVPGGHATYSVNMLLLLLLLLLLLTLLTLLLLLLLTRSNDSCISLCLLWLVARRRRVTVEQASLKASGRMPLNPHGHRRLLVVGDQSLGGHVSAVTARSVVRDKDDKSLKEEDDREAP
jgi:hypothetical protein